MRELYTIGSRNGLFYYGDREGWYVVAGQNASGDALDESNFRVMARALGIGNVGDPYDGPNGQNADDTGLTGDARDWIASAYLSEHDYGCDASTDWDNRMLRDRDTLAYAIRDWRQYRHRAVGKA